VTYNEAVTHPTEQLAKTFHVLINTKEQTLIDNTQHQQHRPRTPRSKLWAIQDKIILSLERKAMLMLNYLACCLKDLSNSSLNY
jgi:hypothetical protein